MGPHLQMSDHQVLSIVPCPQAWLLEGGPGDPRPAKGILEPFIALIIRGLWATLCLVPHLGLVIGPTRGIKPQKTELLESLGHAKPFHHGRGEIAYIYEVQNKLTIGMIRV